MDELDINSDRTLNPNAPNIKLWALFTLISSIFIIIFTSQATIVNETPFFYPLIEQKLFLAVFSVLLYLYVGYKLSIYPFERRIKVIKVLFTGIVIASSIAEITNFYIYKYQIIVDSNPVVSDLVRPIGVIGTILYLPIFIIIARPYLFPMIFGFTLGRIFGKKYYLGKETLSKKKAVWDRILEG